VPTKDQLPAILFGIGLLTLTVTLPLIYTTDAAAWCDADDRSVAVCLRNWAGAGGSLVAVVIAGLAASFTYGQLKTASRQADLATLEPLEHRIAVAKKLSFICLNYSVGISTLKEHLVNLVEAVSSDGFSYDRFQKSVLGCTVRNYPGPCANWDSLIPWCHGSQRS
jgi:hypothetical protein